MKLTNTQFRKNGKYATRNYGYMIGWLLLLAGMLLLSSYINSRSTGLVSPLVMGPVRPVYAKEPEVVVQCEKGPKQYLECQVYQGKITWEDHEKLSKIIKCESGWNSEALNKNTNGTFDVGLFQINSVHKQKPSEMLDFKKNIDFGIKMYKRQGVTPWVCARKLNIK